MAANSNIQLTSLDFDSLKTNFVTYLQSQNTFKDYNFEGSALNTLIDLLTYNTQYGAYYLNQVANEMFLDSAVQRSSVVSHAKMLNYTPKSSIAPTATIQLTFNGVTANSLTLPAYLTFSSSAIDNVNYTFVNPNSYTVNTVGGVATFNNVNIKQGVYVKYSYTVSSTTNPEYLFEIPDSSIDTTTLQVTVQQSASNTAYNVYNLAKTSLALDSTSQVYFLQEGLNGNYQIYFGDGIIGQQLTDGNIVIVKYLSTEGSAAAGANSFVLMDSVNGYSGIITPIIAATHGGDKESIDSVKFQAPKSYAAQGRAVTKNDYITAIQQNTLGIAFDAVNVWGGEQNSPPVYGQVFISMKPSGGYLLTDAQKLDIINKVINPISVLTVQPTIIDPDYTYINLSVNVIYDPLKTTKTSAQIQAGVVSAIESFGASSLNTFNSTFNSYNLLNAVQSYDNSIITSEYSMQLQKRFFPKINQVGTYRLYYGTSLKRNLFTSGVNSYPAVTFLDPNDVTKTVQAYFEEVPIATYGIDSITISNPGFSYQYAPNITILGDGTGATAHAVISGGKISSIVVDTAGINYTSAVVVITPQPGDTTGTLGSATASLQGQYGTLRTYYYNSNNVKSILNSNAGTIDYYNGIITLTSFGPTAVNNSLGQLLINATPATSIISSSFNRIITIDPYDPVAITVTVPPTNS